MTEYTIPLLVALGTLAPFWLAYGLYRLRARYRLREWLTEPRPWAAELAGGGRVSTWLAPAWKPDALPATLSLATVLAEWATVDPDLLADLRLSKAWRGLPQGNLNVLLASAWEALPGPARERSEQRLRAALHALEGWWSGAERGWTGRPFVLPPSLAPKSRNPLPCLIVQDLTAAPRPGPFVPTAEATGVDLPLLYALQRRTPPRFVHPLAPPGAPAATGIAALAGNVATQVGQRVGARLGGILGPIGSAVGQYLGGMAGQLAGGAAQRQALADPLREALGDAEEAIARLGETAAGSPFVDAVSEPERRILARGREWERSRARRARAFRQKFWPTLELAVVESCMDQALTELHGVRDIVATLRERAMRADPVLRGGLLLQNPWLARSLTDGPARLSAARAALNAAARRVGKTG